MEHIQIHFLVLGFGKGGKMPAAATGRRGKRVVMGEQPDRMFGGACINIGCVPTKALIHHAETRPQDHSPGPWYRPAIGATAALTNLLCQKDFQMLGTIDAVTVITGQASFRPLVPSASGIAANVHREGR